MAMEPNAVPADGVASTVEDASARGVDLTRPLVRFLATLVTSTGRSALSFAAGVIVAAGLGAESYGNLAFLLAAFAAVSGFTDLGASTAFFTFLSRSNQPRAFMRLYLAWLVTQFGVVGLVVLLAPASVIRTLFVNESRTLVLIAFLANFSLSQIWNAVVQMGEAVRKTVLVQITALAPAVVHLVAVVALRAAGALTVPAVLWLTAAEYVIAAAIVGPRLARANVSDNEAPLKPIIASVVVYCRPLILYSWLGLVYGFADRWLLQRFAGAAQQGYFSIAQQLSTVSLLVTSAVLSVFWKEVAAAREASDADRVARLFRITTRSLFFASCWLCCLLAPFSREVLVFTVGRGYERAWLSLILLLLYPAYQTVSQIQSVLFYATSETKAYAAFGILMMIVSLPAAYFLLAPSDAAVRGLGLGAFGVALKMLVVQVISVLIQNRWISRRQQWRGDVWYLLGLPAGLLAISWACRLLVSGGWLGSVAAASYTGFLLSVSLYAALTLVTVWFRPEVAGISRSDARRFLTNPMQLYAPAAGRG